MVLIEKFDYNILIKFKRTCRTHPLTVCVLTLCGEQIGHFVELVNIACIISSYSACMYYVCSLCRDSEREWVYCKVF